MEPLLRASETESRADPFVAGSAERAKGKGVRTRRWLAGTAVGVFLVAMFLSQCPFDFYWRWVWPVASFAWPLAVAAILATMFFPGYQHVRSTGEMHFPQWPCLALLASILASTWLLTLPDASAWNWTWAAVVGVVWAAGSMGAVVALLNYFEFWRWQENRVRSRIRQDIHTGRLHHRIKATLNLNPVQRSGSPRGMWGEKFVLELLETEYRARLADIVRQVDSTGFPSSLTTCANVAECLIDFLSLNWPEGVMSDGMRIRKVTEIRRQLLTLTIWFARHGGLDESGIRWVYQWLNGPGGWNRLTQDDHSPYAEFLRLLFELALPSGVGRFHAKGELLSDAKLVATVQQVQASFLAVPTSASHEETLADGDVCAMTWLAIANQVPWRVKFDMWLWMCEQRRVPHRFEDRPHDGDDPVTRCARLALQECYDAWQRGHSRNDSRDGEVHGLPAPWRKSGERLAQYAKDASFDRLRAKCVEHLLPKSTAALATADVEGRTAESILRAATNPKTSQGDRP